MTILVIALILVCAALLYALATTAATAQQATAATVMLARQTGAAQTTITVLALALAATVIIAAIVIGYLSLRLRATHRPPARQWAPGPNAGWRTLGQQQPTPQPPPPPQIGQQQSIDTLIQMQLLAAMRALTDQNTHRPTENRAPGGWPE